MICSLQTQLLFLDADTIVLNPVGEAWKCKRPLCAVHDAWLPVFFNTGVMVLSPNMSMYEKIMSAGELHPGLVLWYDALL